MMEAPRQLSPAERAGFRAEELRMVAGLYELGPNPDHAEAARIRALALEIEPPIGRA